MAHRITRSAAAIALATAWLPGAALAEGIAGSWKFQTDRLPSNGCTISGDIVFHETKTAGRFACEFVSREDCTTPEGVETFQKVKQSCSAELDGETVTITSKVEQVLDAGPAEERNRLMRTDSYLPDDFSVHANDEGGFEGFFHSIQKAGVRFWRAPDLVS
ncbi:MAG: hypothetical protein GC155_10405 [Alphaproteobacteria bacterium]|nr:hypothetical protein [Alphaproteobacteria bacterium]